MLKKSPILHLVAVILTYFALWFLVPKATFFPKILNAITHTMPHTGKFGHILLSICGLLVLALPMVAFMAVQVAIVYFYSRFKLKGWQALSLLAGFLVVALGFGVLIVQTSGIPAKLHRFPNLQEFLYIIGVIPHPLRVPMVLMIMLAAASIGYLVSLRIKDKNLLLPVVMFAAAIDCWTVARGPVSQIIQNAPHISQAVSAPIPQAGAGSFVPVTMIGPGDFLFMGLVFAVIWRLGMNARRNYWSVFIMMTLGMLGVMFGIVEKLTGLAGLPALTVLAVAIVGANWREFKLSKQEAISIAIVGAILAISVPVVWSVFRPTPQKPVHKPRPAVTAPERGRK